MKNEWEEKLQSFLKAWVKKERMLVIILLGIILMVASFPTKRIGDDSKQQEGEGNKKKEIQELGISAYQNMLEEKLEDLLITISGIESVKVMITLKNMGEKEVLLESDIERKETKETDAGGTRSVVEEKVKEDSGGRFSMGQSESPYVLSERLPQIEGVVVVAKYNHQGAMEMELTQAVSALFDIDAHKIKVLKMD